MSIFHIGKFNIFAGSFSRRILIDTTGATLESEPWIMRHDMEKIQYIDYDDDCEYIKTALLPFIPEHKLDSVMVHSLIQGSISNMSIDLVVIIDEEKLKADETHKFIEKSFCDGVLKTTGTDIDDILPAVSRFGGRNRVEKKKRVIDRLMVYFEKYFDSDMFGWNLVKDIENIKTNELEYKKNIINLLKLHGSLTWERDDKGIRRKEKM